MLNPKMKPWVFPDGVSAKRPHPALWHIWENMPVAPLWKIVSLHCGIDPDFIHEYDKFPAIAPRALTWEWYYEQHLTLACAHVEVGRLECLELNKDRLRNSRVELPVYAEWSEELGYELPERFPRERFTKSAKAADDAKPAIGRWPWGAHDTELLDHLAAAGEHWRLVCDGGQYDPTDAATAPKSKEVMVPWLIARGVAAENAKVIARLLIDDGIRPGPRGRKK